jgi:hypothetical protein
MRGIAIWVEEDHAISQQFRLVPASGHCKLRPAVAYHLDYRYKAPRKHIARSLRVFVNAYTDNSVNLVINQVADPPLLWKRIWSELDSRTLNTVYVVPARDMNHLIQKFTRKMAQFLYSNGEMNS